MLAEARRGVHPCRGTPDQEIEHRRFTAVRAAEECHVDRVMRWPPGDECRTDAHAQLGHQITCHRYLMCDPIRQHVPARA